MHAKSSLEKALRFVIQAKLSAVKALQTTPHHYNGSPSGLVWAEVHYRAVLHVTGQSLWCLAYLGWSSLPPGVSGDLLLYYSHFWLVGIMRGRATVVEEIIL